MKVILYPVLCALIVLLGFISLLWLGGAIKESASKKTEYYKLLENNPNDSARITWENAIKQENASIAQNSVILMALLIASGSAVTVMVLNTLEILRDPFYIHQRKIDKAKKYSKMLTELHPDKNPQPKPKYAPTYDGGPIPSLDKHLSGTPASSSAAATAAKPGVPAKTGRPIIRPAAPVPPPGSAGKPSAAPAAPSSKLAAALPTAAVKRPPERNPLLHPGTLTSTVPTYAPSPLPSAEPPPPENPDEFPHEFPDIEEEPDAGAEYYEGGF